MASLRSLLIPLAGILWRRVFPDYGPKASDADDIKFFLLTFKLSFSQLNEVASWHNKTLTSLAEEISYTSNWNSFNLREPERRRDIDCLEAFVKKYLEHPNKRPGLVEKRRARKAKARVFEDSKHVLNMMHVLLLRLKQNLNSQANMEETRNMEEIRSLVTRMSALQKKSDVLQVQAVNCAKESTAWSAAVNRLFEEAQNRGFTDTEREGFAAAVLTADARYKKQQENLGEESRKILEEADTINAHAKKLLHILPNENHTDID